MFANPLSASYLKRMMLPILLMNLFAPLTDLCASRRNARRRAAALVPGTE